MNNDQVWYVVAGFIGGASLCLCGLGLLLDGVRLLVRWLSKVHG